MVEAIALPLLNKALTLLFDEGKKILQEILERRKEPTDAEQQSEEIVEPRERDDVITSKELALSQTIDERVWSESEKDIEHLHRLLELNTRAYRLAEESYNMYGRELVPRIVVNRLIEAEEGVEKTTKRLKDALSKVYGKEIIIS